MPQQQQQKITKKPDHNFQNHSPDPILFSYLFSVTKENNVFLRTRITSLGVLQENTDLNKKEEEEENEEEDDDDEINQESTREQ